MRPIASGVAPEMDLVALALAIIDEGTTEWQAALRQQQQQQRRLGPGPDEPSSDEGLAAEDRP